MIYGCESVKSGHQKDLLRIVMSKNKHKNEQEDQEKANIYKVITTHVIKTENILEIKILMSIKKFYELLLIIGSTF